jgi:hypothetical protein
MPLFANCTPRQKICRGKGATRLRPYTECGHDFLAARKVFIVDSERRPAPAFGVI